MKTINPYLISKLYTWTVRDLNLIYDRCFDYNFDNGKYDGPSSTYSIALAALIDTWGSILNDKFGVKGNTDNNVTVILSKLSKLDNGKNKKYYKIFDSKGVIKSDIVKLFRHNLIHDFGKKLEKPEYDLNITSDGLAIDQQNSNKRWHINCKKLKEDFLNLLRLELPDLLKN